jgi:acetyl-CoA decarbonylase/synthase complex subunit beta
MPRVCDANELRSLPTGVKKPTFPVDIGEMHEGERVRKPQMYLEFGGLKVEKKWELVRTRNQDEIKDARIIIDGPDISELKDGESYPLGILVEVAGKKVEKDITGVLERRLHYFLNYIEGVMHVNQRYDIWIRLTKDAYNRGLNSLEWFGKALIWLYKTSFPILETIQVTFYTEPKQIAEHLDAAMKIWSERDERARSLKDENVKDFYGCIMCQSFAPSHMCVITPNRTGSCGSISWFDARAASNIDPNGPNFVIPKGDIVDTEKGIYGGVDKVLQEKSLGSVQSVSIYSMFENPHTSCGCFEGIAFYIPELDGVGVVHRDFRDETVNGLTFSGMAANTSGGIQSPGFNGIAVEYLRSPRFLKPDGGWNRVLWMPMEIKERVKDSIPAEIIDKIATESDVKNLEELRGFLTKINHPITERWSQQKTDEIEEKEVSGDTIPEMETNVPPDMQTVIQSPTMQIPTSGGFKIILKNAKITAEKVIIKRIEKK